MENNAPLKRHEAIVSFSKDHHFGLLLVWKIRQGLKKAVLPERISKYVLFFFEEDLVNHFKDEEQLLFSRLPADDALRIQAEAEHREVYELIALIKDNIHDVSLLNKMADTLEQHIRFEERTLFGHLQNSIGENELEEIALRMAGSGKDIDEKWDDIFWVGN